MKPKKEDDDWDRDGINIDCVATGNIQLAEEAIWVTPFKSGQNHSNQQS